MRFLDSKPFVTLLGVLTVALFTRSSARAAEPTPSEISVARRLFEEGKTAEEAGRFREASQKFRSATAIKDTPGMRFHLAHCEEEQGAFVEALVEYDRARELIDSGIKAADVEKLLAAARERVRAKVALLTLKLPEDVHNVSVELDGKALSASVLGVPMPINPGKHQLSAVAVGRTTFQGAVELGTGEVRQLVIELPVATMAPPVSVTHEASPPLAVKVAPLPPPADTSKKVVLISEASLFVVALGTGVGFTIARSSDNRRFDKANTAVLDQVGGSDPDGTACSEPRPGCEALDQARKDRSRDGTLAAAGFVAAGVSAAAFGLTYWLWPRSGGQSHVSAALSPKGDLRLGISGQF